VGVFLGRLNVCVYVLYQTYLVDRCALAQQYSNGICFTTAKKKGAWLARG
jgi:hypothetical protein